jgi:hypothetical protein
MVVQHLGELGDREDEDEVEEELQRRDPDLVFLVWLCSRRVDGSSIAPAVIQTAALMA